MKKFIVQSLISALLVIAAGCEKYLDINENPNNPQTVSPNLYLPSIESAMGYGIQYDARYLGKYIQNWAATSAEDTWDRHGYLPASDAGAEMWRAVYWLMGQNLTNLIELSEEQERWDLAGAGKAMRAWGWQMLTDFHGPIILSQAFEPGRRVFDYDEQEAVYAEVVRLCNESLEQLSMTDGTVSQSFWENQDLIYGGDTEKWKKFVYGLLAINTHNLSNKPGYDPQAVIDYVDQSFAGNEDNAQVQTAGSVNDDTNFFGPRRDNITNFRQTVFILGLLNGDTFGITDPRLPVMLVPAPDGEYRGVVPTYGYSDMPEEERPNTLWDTPSLPDADHQGKFIFGNDEPIPVMTYFQLQFIKAEAALDANNPDLALQAYRNGIEAHMEFCGVDPGAMNAYMNSEAVAQTPAELTRSDIMLQKYIALWGWGFLETWNDLRRYNYSSEVFTGFELPPASRLYSDNGGKPAYRFRARYNSEYVWNQQALEKVGGLDADYHTRPLWFHQP